MTKSDYLICFASVIAVSSLGMNMGVLHEISEHEKEMEKGMVWSRGNLETLEDRSAKMIQASDTLKQFATYQSEIFRNQTKVINDQIKEENRELDSLGQETRHLMRMYRRKHKEIQ